uniref:Ribosomal protein S6 n=1 Tax=Strongyloides stercoralis TaxID=6248 RepID=A0A0K0DZY6_STRER
MPLYEVTIIPKNLARAELVSALKRTVTSLLDNGAIITEMKSLGQRELPFKRIAKQTKQPVYSSTYLFLKAYMPIEKQLSSLKAISNDLEMLHVHFVNTKELEKPVVECNLDELLKPPAYRDSIETLRKGGKIGHFTKQMIFKRTEKEWKAVPKSYPIPQPKD